MPLKEAFFVAVVGVLTDLSTFIFLKLCCSGSLDNGHALGFIVALIKGCKLWGEQSGHAMRPWIDHCDLDIILDQASSEFQANVAASNDHSWTILLILDGC
jgi:hypothetical protein